MTTDEGVTPKTLADIYVDTCPTNWSTTYSLTPSKNPSSRLGTSALHHGKIGAWTNQNNNGVTR